MKFDKSVMRNLAMITQIGISMLAPVILCVFAGYWIDRRFGWSTVIPLMILGILAGARNTYLLVRRLTDEEGRKKK